MTTVVPVWIQRARVVGLATMATGVIALGALTALSTGAHAQSSSQGFTGAGITPAAQSPGHLATVMSKRIGVRDPLSPAAGAAVVDYQRVVMQAEMFEFTMNSRETRNMRGIEPSLYQGEFFDSAAEKMRRCIVKRESNGHYDVQGGAGNRYFGAYQMSRALSQGVTWMMMDEHKRILGAERAREIMKKLRDLPVTKWPRYWQDAAFSTIYNWKGPGSGGSHWFVGSWRC
jgi:hypothetical protein